VVLCPDVAPYINSRFDCCDLLRSGIHYGARAGLKNLNRGDKWSFCLTAGKIDPRIRRDNEQTGTPEPHTGFQGEGGACRQSRCGESVSLAPMDRLHQRHDRGAF
jgi:hypothetical protein